jgi:sporulation-control protein
VFKSILARLGGGTTLDARLDRSELRAGERLTGTLVVSGGDGSLTAKHAEVKLKTRVEHDDHKRDVVVASARVPGPIRMQGEQRFPFALVLPAYVPVTAYGSRVKVWLASELDVPMAVDPTDADYLEVLPAPEQANVISAMERLGFRLAKTDVEARHSWSGRGFVQEWEFRPTQRGSRYDEIELVFEELSPGRAELLVQLDRSARGLGGMLLSASGMDESWHRVTVDASSPQRAAAGLQRLIG